MYNFQLLLILPVVNSSYGLNPQLMWVNIRTCHKMWQSIFVKALNCCKIFKFLSRGNTYLMPEVIINITNMFWEHFANWWKRLSNIYNIMMMWILFFEYFFKIIMHQSVKLTDAIWLLQMVISSPLIHALDEPSQASNWIRTRVPN